MGVVLSAAAAAGRDRDYRFIAKAVDEAYQAVECGGGNPFGAVIGAAAGFSSTVPDAFVEYYQRSGMEIRQAEGEAAWIAEQVFEKTDGKFRTK